MVSITLYTASSLINPSTYALRSMFIFLSVFVVYNNKKFITPMETKPFEISCVVSVNMYHAHHNKKAFSVPFEIAHTQ